MQRWQVLLHKWIYYNYNTYYVCQSQTHYTVNGVSFRFQLCEVAACRLSVPASLTCECLDNASEEAANALQHERQRRLHRGRLNRRQSCQSKKTQDSSSTHGLSETLTRKQIVCLLQDWLKSSLTSFLHLLRDGWREKPKRVKVVYEVKLGISINIWLVWSNSDTVTARFVFNVAGGGGNPSNGLSWVIYISLFQHITPCYIVNWGYSVARHETDWSKTKCTDLITTDEKDWVYQD